MFQDPLRRLHATVAYRRAARWRCVVAAVSCALLAVPTSPARADSDPDAAAEERLELPFTEEQTVSLTLVDVEVYDRKGNPRPGLVADDFEVLLSGRPWPVYSVDDFCACPAESAQEPTGAEPAPTEPPPPETGRREPRRTVLYFDLGQLRPNGRHRATDAAMSWLDTAWRPDDEVMVVAYGLGVGVTELVEFTSDRERIRAAIEEVRGLSLDTELPQRLRSRTDLCTQSPAACAADVPTDFFYTDTAVDRLRWFVAGLDVFPGRKTLVYFYQSSADPVAGGTTRGDRVINLLQGVDDADPNEDFVDGALSDRPIEAGIVNPLVSPQTRDLEELLAAEAVSSRTTLYMAFAGDSLAWVRGGPDDALGWGARLAEATGGHRNRALADLDDLLVDGSTRCSCYYRIGLRPPDKRRERIFKMRVQVAGQVLPHRYRVQFLTEGDRWLRRVVGVLSRPELARELPVGAALVPLRTDGRRWDVAVQVALDSDALAMIPIGGRWRGRWEVGAVLTHGDDEKAWEMLGVSQVQHGASSPPYAAILHEQVFTGLRPGDYSLVAFVRDQERDLFGGAQAAVRLPAPTEVGQIGPVLRLAEVPYLATPLPRSDGEGERSTGETHFELGSTPPPVRPLAPRWPVAFHTWLCDDGGAGGAEPPPPIRFVTRGGRPFVRLPATRPPASGRCREVVDRLPTATLPPGEYVYYLRATVPGGASAPPVPLDLSLPFTVGARAPVTAAAHDAR